MCVRSNKKSFIQFSLIHSFQIIHSTRRCLPIKRTSIKQAKGQRKYCMRGIQREPIPPIFPSARGESLNAPASSKCGRGSQLIIIISKPCWMAVRDLKHIEYQLLASSINRGSPHDDQRIIPGCCQKPSQILATNNNNGYGVDYLQ